MEQSQQTDRLRRLLGETGPTHDGVLELAAIHPDLLGRLMRISHGFATGMPFERLLNEIAAVTAQVLESEIVLIRQISDDDANYLVLTAVGPAPLSTGGLVGAYSAIPDRARTMSPGDIVSVNLLDPTPHPLLSASDAWSLQQLGGQHAVLLPLFAGGLLTGRLDIVRTRNTSFEPDAIAIANLIGVFAAQAIHTHTLEMAAKESHVVQTVLGLHQSIEHLADPHTIFQAVVELVVREPGAARCYAMLWDSGRNEFIPTAVAGLEPHMVDMLKLVSLSPQVAPAFDQMMHSNRPLVVGDATKSTLLPQSLVRALGIRAAMIVPLRGRHHQTIGFLLVDQNEEGVQFTDHQVMVMSGMARHLAAMIENAILYEQAVSSSETLSVINEIGIQLAMLTDEPSLFRQLHYHVASAVDASYFALALLSDDRASLEVWEARDGVIGQNSVTIPHDDDLLSRTIKTGRSALAGTRSADGQAWPPEAGPGDSFHSRITVPITVGRNVIGALSVHSPFRHAYGPQDLELLTAIALHTGVAIENARLYRLTQDRGDRRAVVLDAVMSRHELERKELVDDIHENTLQTLAACLFQLELAQDSAEIANPDSKVAGGLARIHQELSSSIDELRKKIFALRPATLDILGLEPALREYVRSFAGEDGDATSLEISLPGRLSPDDETIVYRIVQEALTHMRLLNRQEPVAIRLKTNETEASIALRSAGDQRVAGIGLADGSGDVGLMALIERVELAGGNLNLNEDDLGRPVMLISVPIRPRGYLKQTNRTSEDTKHG